MPWKLGHDPDKASRRKSDKAEPTVAVTIKMPASMKRWLLRQQGGLSRFIRALVSAKMNDEGVQKVGTQEEEQ